MGLKINISGKILLTRRTWQQFVLKLTVFIKAKLLWYSSTLTLSSLEAKQNQVSDSSEA